MIRALNLTFRLFVVSIPIFMLLSLLRFASRRLLWRLKKQNISFIGKPAKIHCSAVLVSIPCDIAGIFFLHSTSRSSLSGLSLILGIIIAFILLLGLVLSIFVAFKANREIVCDNLGIIEYRLPGCKRRILYPDISCISADYRTIWHKNHKKYLEINCPSHMKKDSYVHICNLCDREIPVKDPENAPSQNMKVFKDVGLPLIAIMIIGEWTFAGMSIYFDTRMVNENNTEYFQITFSDFFTNYNNRDDCIILIYSPELGTTFSLGSGKEWAEKDGTVMTCEDIDGHLYFDNFGSTIEKLQSKCDGNTKFHMYGEYNDSKLFYKKYSMYYLEDDEGTVYIDFDTVNEQRNTNRIHYIIFAVILSTVLSIAVIGYFTHEFSDEIIAEISLKKSNL